MARLLGLIVLILTGTATVVPRSVLAAEDTVADCLRRLESGEDDTKLRALKALGKLGPAASDAPPGVVPYLEHSSASFRAEAATALGRICAGLSPQRIPEPKREAKAGSTPPDYRPAVGKPNSSGLINLDVRDKELAQVARFIGARIGAEIAAEPKLLVTATFERKPWRDALAEVATKSGCQINVGDDGVLRLTRPQGFEAAVSALIEASRDPDSRVRDSAIRALGEIGPRSAPAVDRLGLLLRDDSSRTRSLAARALGRIGSLSPVLVRRLVALLADKNEGVRSEARAAIRDLGRPAVPALLAQEDDSRPGKLKTDALRALGREAVRELLAIQTSRSEHYSTQQSAKHALLAWASAASPGNDLVEGLVDSLSDDRLCTTAMVALLRVDASAEPSLLKALSIEDSATRRGAVAVLGSVEPMSEATVAALVAALKYADSRASVLLALRDRADVLTRLLAALADEDAALREGVAAALGELHAPVSVENSSGADLREVIVKALVSTRRTDSSARVRAAAIDSLARIDPASLRGERLAFDGFDGELALDWKIIGEHPTHHSLTKSPGALTITTQKGGFTEKYDDVKNLFYIDNPAKNRDFEVTTRIDGFLPGGNSWQQAGLTIFEDLDNFARCVLTWRPRERKRSVQLFGEKHGRNIFKEYYDWRDSERLWLRLTKRGRSYAFSASSDGRTFKRFGSWSSSFSPRYIGFFAKNSAVRSAPEVDVTFAFLEVFAMNFGQDKKTGAAQPASGR